MPFLNLATAVNLAAPVDATQFSASQLIISMDMPSGTVISADVIYCGGTVANGVFTPATGNLEVHLNQTQVNALLASSPATVTAVAGMIYGAIQTAQGVTGTIA